MITNLNSESLKYYPKYLTLDINQTIHRSSYVDSDITFTDYSGGTTVNIEYLLLKGNRRLIDSGNTVTKYVYLFNNGGAHYPEIPTILTYSGEVVPIPSSSTGYNHIRCLIITGPSDSSTIIPGIDFDSLVCGGSEYPDFWDGEDECFYLPSLPTGTISEIECSFGTTTYSDAKFKLYTPPEVGTYIVQRSVGTVSEEKHILRENSYINSFSEEHDNVFYYIERLP